LLSKVWRVAARPGGGSKVGRQQEDLEVVATSEGGGEQGLEVAARSRDGGEKWWRTLLLGILLLLGTHLLPSVYPAPAQHSAHYPPLARRLPSSLCVLLFMLEAVEGWFCLPEVLKVLKGVLLCMQEAVGVGTVCWRWWKWWS
jgi:hypothetical protein